MYDTFFNRLFALASLVGAIGVMFGAFGAHFLKARLPERDLETIKTGVLYLFIHTLVVLLIYAISGRDIPSRWLRAAGITFIAGIFMFSGSLFLIGTEMLTGIPASAIGFITPVGGLCFIGGWVLLILHSLKI